jgi:uncharacterized protein (TIGR03437 family)
MRFLDSILASTAVVALVAMVNAQTPTSTIFNPAPSRIVGQAVLQQQGILTATGPNLVEGREFNGPQAIAIDTSVSPPILYVADSGNNRVLAWKNAAAFTKGTFADKVIGQRDFLTISAKGPGSGLTTGVSAPDALAVDNAGNLYVVDAGNNRILRYPAPFSQTGALLAVNLIIGQKDLNGAAPNAGQTAPSATTLALTSGGAIFRTGLAFDAQGNLWISDAGNNRVLRYPAGSLGPHATNQPAADLVLGQPDFVSNQIPQNASQSACAASGVTSQRCGLNFLIQPAGLGFDAKGRLFVPDNLNRVVVYTAPFSIGQAGTRIMGVVLPTKQNPVPPSVSESTLGVFTSGGGAVPPSSVFFVASNPYVVDTGNSRILGYAPFDQWADTGTAFSPPATVVIGQTSFTGFQANQALTEPTASTLNNPVAAIFSTDLYVVDAGNARVLSLPEQSGGTFGPANRLLGQLDFQYNSVNLIEGREVGFTANFGSCVVNGAFPFVTGGAVAIDASSNPPHLYIADPLNNRILGFKDYRKVNAGAAADLVIGQPDLRTALLNYPSNNPTQANNQGLWSPEGLAVDSKGNLYVADTCNARVLRFPTPFTQTSGNMQSADLVLGQPGFFGQPIRDLSSETMRSSYGLAFSSDGSLLVSDPLANRILYFRKPVGADFISGSAAASVFGQADFISTTLNVLSGPHHISLDSGDQLYVADTGNNRIAVFPNVAIAGNNPPVTFSLTGVNAPFAVTIEKASGEIWATNTNGNQLLRFPKFEQAINNPAPTATIGVALPLAVTLDPFGNPVLAEGINRVSFYYPAIDFTTAAGGLAGRLSGNGANFFGRFAPGMLASIFAFSNAQFGSKTASFSSLPVPTTLGDVQVLVADVAAPVLYASPSQINFQVPSATPTGGPQEIQVVRASTGEVLASWLFRIDVVSPGLFTADSSGSGQLAAVNQDGTVNNGAHPAKAGTYVTLFGTGQGLVNGMPPDGQPAPKSPLLTTDPALKVFINSDFVPQGDIEFSGLAPGFVGLWQINVKVPANVPPGDVPVFVDLDGINSVLDPNGIRRVTTIRVTP